MKITYVKFILKDTVAPLIKTIILMHGVNYLAGIMPMDSQIIFLSVFC